MTQQIFYYFNAPFYVLAFEILVVSPLHSTIETKCDQAQEKINEHLGLLEKIGLASRFPSDNSDNSDATSEIIHISRRRKIWTSSTKYAASYPHQEPPNSYGYRSEILRVIGGFGGKMDGAAVVGNYKSVYQYDVEKDRWIDIDKNSKNVEPRDYAKGCSIGDSFLVYGEKAELLQFKPWRTKIYDYFPLDQRQEAEEEEEKMMKHWEGLRDGSVQHENWVSVQLKIEKESRPLWKKVAHNIKKFTVPPSNSETKKPPIRMLRNQIYCNKPSVNLGWHSITNIGYDKVLLTGEFGQMFYGHLTWDMNIKWKRLPNIELKKGCTRSRYIVFKMKDHVYFAGGYISPSKIEESEKSLACDKFYLKEQKWVTCKHSLPYPIEHASVVVSSDESCAVITGGQKDWKKKCKPSNRIIVFEEESGFTVLNNRMIRRRSNHVSIMLN